ncbi:unnamed protein product [Heligmosomoides polygyrus]|uniref:L-Fucosyltransferase n=1 Tax=Heligmosomoides polygyrus TaxID=6339 RepID=A0A183G1Y6_HELPZ|nr:unnamed protein product [Heligmosomoides polygyrus]
MGREDVLQNRSHTMAIQQDWSKCERFSNFTAGAQERVMSTAESEGRSLLRSTAHVSHFPMAVEASQRQVAMGHMLDFRYAQNVRYFDFMLPEIRHLLAFSDDVQREGDQVLHRWNIHNATAMCVHIRRSDFVQLHVASDLHDSVGDVIRIAERQDFDKFIIFGDDTDFMRRMAEAIEMQRNGIRKSRARFSTNTEGVDFYIASRACGAMLITAPTSTFGWWLAFFIPNQEAVYYRGSDKRRMVDKVPQKDLFL